MADAIAVIKLIYELVMAAKSLVTFIQENKHEAWFQESSKVFTELRNAKTAEEKKQIARKLRDLWGSI